MKKTVIIPIIACVLILVIGIIGFVLFNNNNKIITTITLDINPSIEIGLNKDNKVVKVTPLNNDGKDIVSNNLKNKSLDEALELITDNIVEKGYAEEDHVAIILYSDGLVDNDKIKENIEKNFENKQKRVEIVVIDEVTKEDEELAKKYNISPAKVSYIESIISDKDNISVEDFSNKPINELQDTKVTGNYCPNGYTLEGSWCYKEVGKKESRSDEVCPGGYIEYKGKCYEELGIIDTGKVSCPDGFTLEGNDCIRKNYIDASVESYSCSKGMLRTKGEVGMAPTGSGPAKDPVCVDTTTTHPVTVCNLPASDPTERMLYNGKCYWHRAPVIESGCPGKIQVNGSCWDSAEGIYMCPNGYNSNTRTKDDECYTVLKNVKPTINGYKCDEDNMILEGNKCIKTENAGVLHERTCPDKATLIDNDYCINFDKTADKVNGYVCDDENTRLKGKDCIVYDIIEASHS